MFKTAIKNPFFIFCLSVFLISVPLFIFPINLFDGEIIMQNGLSESKIKAPLSLSYFIGLGYNKEEMQEIKNFYLLPKGYFLAFCIVLGFPALLAYRVYLANKKKDKAI